VRLEKRHDLTLLGEDVLDGCRDMLWLPQPAHAPMACPAFPSRIIQPHPIQTSTCVSFKSDHNLLRRNLSCHHGMHVAASDVDRQEAPASTRTDLLDRFEDGGATDLVQVIGRLIHSFQRSGGTGWIQLQERASDDIMLAVDGA
jgi:hypothetical protein